jgi:hypothetical protein
MEQFKINPFVGKNYGKSKSIFKGKVLIVLESPYFRNKDSAYQDFVKDAIPEIINDGWYKKDAKLYNTVSAIILGKWPDQHNIGDYSDKFWNSIVLYEYLQTLSFTAPRQPVPEKLWKESHKYFLNILSKYQPNTVIIFSKRTYNQIISHTDIKVLENKTTLKFNTSCEYSKIKYKAFEFNILIANHPSSKTSWSEVHKDITKGLKYVGNGIE